ncbi:MAG: hypothetical protein J6V44_12745 [Methanobrevibacter sp.]|nr:hypothetical protein [Methanobrevibacter sp.]
MKKLNIAELLRDCPTGMELDCTICDNVYLDEVTPHMIKCFSKDNVYNTIYFHHDGTYLTNQNAKCVIFPKGKTTWEGFQRPFKEGDILYIDCNDDGNTDEQFQYIFILKEINGSKIYSYCFVTETNEYKFEICYLADRPYQPRFATEKEKEKLFKAIKDNDYRWNAETKTLEKLPRFKVGDQIVKRNSISNSWIVASVSSEYYGLKLPNGSEDIGVLLVSEQDDYELVQAAPKFKVGDRVKHIFAHRSGTVVKVVDKGYYIDYPKGEGVCFISFMLEKDYELVPNKFDITTLKPFDKVLIRDSDKVCWYANIYSHYLGKDKLYQFRCIGTITKQCIPYEGNEHLLGTTNNCDSYFKTWE